MPADARRAESAANMRNLLQLFKLLRVALKHGNDRLQFCQLIPMLLDEARGFLRFVKAFLDLIHAIGQRVIGQQIQTRQQAVECGYALFACSYCTRFCWLSLSWAVSARPVRRDAYSVYGFLLPGRPQRLPQDGYR